MSRWDKIVLTVAALAYATLLLCVMALVVIALKDSGVILP